MGFTSIRANLDTEAERNKETDKTVTITMTVESKEESAADHASDIKDVAGEDKKLEYLEIKVEKKVNDEEPVLITETTNLLTIVIPYDFTDKTDVVVYRYHGDGPEDMDKDPAAGREGYKLDEDNGFITIYSKNFSTYAIGYTKKEDTSEPPSGPAPVQPPEEDPDPTPAPPSEEDPGSGGPSGGSSSGGSSGGGSSPTAYPVDVPGGIHNGTVSVSPKSASKGTTVTITATPEEGYQIGTVTVTDKDGKEVPVTGKGDGKYTFTMPAGKVNVSASFTKIGGSYAVCPKNDTCPIWRYTDASTTAWYHDGVHYCIENGLMSGYGNNTFGPDGGTSRAMIATILWRLEGGPVVNYILPFDDVAEGAWCAEAIRWAAANGVVNGYRNGKFGPGDPITREQLAAMLYRYEQYKGGGFTGAWMSPLNYTDAELVSSWAYEPMCWTTMNGIINGIGNGLLDPNGKATRAQAAAMIMRFCERP